VGQQQAQHTRKFLSFHGESAYRPDVSGMKKPGRIVVGLDAVVCRESVHDYSLLPSNWRM